MMQNSRNQEACQLGPSYFERLATKIPSLPQYKNIEWKGKLNHPIVQIKFYGDYQSYESYEHSLIISTDFAPQKVIAVDNTEQEVILFDGCKHGYNAMFCDRYTPEQLNNREASQLLFPDNTEQFEVILSAYYQCDYEEEFSDEIDEQGNIQLIDGSYESFANIKRNGFDFFGIYILDKTNKIYPILQEELA